MNKVLIILANGFEEIEAITVIDILRRAEIPVTVAGLEELVITGSHDIKIRCDVLLSEVQSEPFRMLVLPGGQPGTNNLKSSHSVLDLVKKFHLAGKFIAAICAAPTVLEKAGIVQSVKLTSYPSEKPIFDEKNYIESEVVVDGNIITSRGVGTAIAFALELVEVLKNDHIRRELAARILWKE